MTEEHDFSFQISNTIALLFPGTNELINNAARLETLLNQVSIVQQLLRRDDQQLNVFMCGASCIILRSLRELKGIAQQFSIKIPDEGIYSLDTDPPILASQVSIGGCSLYQLSNPHTKIRSSDYVRALFTLLKTTSADVLSDDERIQEINQINKANASLNENPEIVSESVYIALQYFATLFFQPAGFRTSNQKMINNPYMETSLKKKENLLYQAYVTNNTLVNRLNELRLQACQDIIKTLTNQNPDTELLETLSAISSQPALLGKLLRELNVTDPKIIRTVYRALREKSRIQSPYQSLFSEMLSYVETEIENNPEFNPQSDLEGFFTCEHASPNPTLWTSLSQINKQLGNTKGASRATLVVDDIQLQAMASKSEVSLSRATIRLDPNKPHTCFSITFYFTNLGSAEEEPVPFTVKIDTKKQRIEDWSCVIAPDDPEAIGFQKSILDLSLQVLQTYTSHVKQEKPAEATLRRASTPQQVKKSSTLLGQPTQSPHDVKPKAMPKTPPYHSEPQTAEPETPTKSRENKPKFAIPPDINKLLESLPEKDREFLRKKLSYVHTLDQDPKKMVGHKDIYTYRLGIYYRLVLEKNSNGTEFPYRILAIVPRKELKKFLASLKK